MIKNNEKSISIDFFYFENKIELCLMENTIRGYTYGRKKKPYSNIN